MELTPDSDDPPPEVTWAVRLQASRLVVREPNRREVPYPLDGKPFRLGRADDNRIVVKAEFVAAHQLRFEPTGVGDGYRVRDLGGPCSLMFNGHPVTEHELRHGDVLRVGDPYTGSFVTITYQRLARTLAPPDEQVPRCRLDQAEVTIGREGCEVTLASLLVSRRHATVRAVGDGHEVRDLGSANGTFVNGERIQAKKLARGDIIQIGPFKLVYDGRSLNSYDHRGAMELKARRLVRVVGGGKVILDRVSLAILPREFVAIVGGSGAGKSTLLGALSGFSRASEGEVLVNGDDYYANFDAYRGQIGYVPQSDILHQTLTVDEALRFTAMLRLPEDTGEAEIAARVERVLADVDIEDRRTTRISELSGGQRKRVSIAAELLADPSLFFLDEPTSGLDPGLEKRLMYTLRRLADAGRTVVMVTHATANIHQCDHIAFMADGRLVWFGPPADALQHFGVRSGDFADIYTKVDGQATASHPLVQGELRSEYARWREANERGEPTLAELWELRYRRSDARTRYIVERLAGGPRSPAVKPNKLTTSQQSRSSMSLTAMKIGAMTPEDRPEAARVSAWRQCRILIRRNLRLLAVDRRNLTILLLQAPIIGAILVLVAKPTALQDLQSSHGRLVLFLVALVAVWCGILCSARELTKERAIYRRERLANLRIGPYLLAKFVVLAGVCLLQSIVLLSVLAIEVDFSAAVTTFTATGPQTVVRGVAGLGFFGSLLVTTFLSSLSGLGMGLLLSSASKTSDRAMSVVPLVLVPQLLLALALVSLPAGLAPLSYLTSARWAMEAFGSIAHLQPPRDFAACEIPGNPLSCPVYPTVDYDPSPAHVFQVWGVLLLYTAVCVGLAAAVLRRRDRER